MIKAILRLAKTNGSSQAGTWIDALSELSRVLNKLTSYADMMTPTSRPQYLVRRDPAAWIKNSQHLAAGFPQLI